MKHALLAGFVLLAFAAPAFAALPPQYYQQARDNAADVVVIDVREVGSPPAQGYGDCAVSGTVAAVERGETYAVGDEITLAVPCMLPDARVPIGGVQWKGVEALRAAPAGRAFLNNGALALYQYEILAAAPDHGAHAGHH